MTQRIVKLVIIVLFLLPVAARSQQLSGITLPQAIDIALQKNSAQKIALAEFKASTADIRLARAGFFPHIAFGESAASSNDPVFAFGTRLRQGRFTAADFSLDRLNHPDALGDFSARFTGEWTLFDSFSNRLNLRRAHWMEQASQHNVDRTGQQTVYATIAAYYNVLFAAKAAQVAEETVHTAEAVMENSQSRVDAGTAVGADALSAKVLLAQRQQELIRASNDLELAKSQFNIVLGLPSGMTAEIAQPLAEHTFSASSLADLEQAALKNRPDILSVNAMSAAQTASVALAKASFGPRLNAFGSWQTDTVNFANNGGNNWTVGAELQIDLFSGGAKLARLQHEKAMQERAAAAKTAAEDNARLEVRRAYFNFDSARKTLEVSRAAVAQSEEALRMMRDRYDSGLATITDLLRTEDAVRQSQINYWQSVTQYSTSYAAMELAAGTLNPSSAVVTQ